MCNGGIDMVNKKSFAVVGGDARQIAMAKSILSDGHDVYLAGFEKSELKEGLVESTLERVIEKSEYVILPVPTVSKNGYLNAPSSNEKIAFDDDFAGKMYGKKVFCCMAEHLIFTSKIWQNIELFDYAKRDDFAIRNAVPTAEGAIEIAMREFCGTIHGSRCLVTGFGRVGKVLCTVLSGLGAKVTASARKSEDLAWISILGYEPILTSECMQKANFDLIFNTIPSLIFDEKTLLQLNPNTIIIDLASLPGGVDFNVAKKLGLKAIHAIALPGKIAPKTAGEIIKITIYNMIEEEHLKLKS